MRSAKSVATIPAISTHQQQGDDGRRLASLPANLIRLNVGAEHADDIVADLDQDAVDLTADLGRKGDGVEGADLAHQLHRWTFFTHFRRTDKGNHSPDQVTENQ